MTMSGGSVKPRRMCAENHPPALNVMSGRAGSQWCMSRLEGRERYGARRPLRGREGGVVGNDCSFGANEAGPWGSKRSGATTTHYIIAPFWRPATLQRRPRSVAGCEGVRSENIKFPIHSGPHEHGGRRNFIIHFPRPEPSYGCLGTASPPHLLPVYLSHHPPPSGTASESYRRGEGRKEIGAAEDSWSARKLSFGSLSRGGRREGRSRYFFNAIPSRPAASHLCTQCLDRWVSGAHRLPSLPPLPSLP